MKADHHDGGGTLALFDTTGATAIGQAFQAWKVTPGAAQILRWAYKLTARRYRMWQRTRLTFGVGLLEEMLRDRIRAGLLGGADWEGFALNSHFTAHIVRHMIAEHAEWSVLFGIREIGKKRTKRKVIVIEEPNAKLCNVAAENLNR